MKSNKKSYETVLRIKMVLQNKNDAALQKLLQPIKNRLGKNTKLKYHQKRDVIEMMKTLAIKGLELSQMT